MSSQVSKKEDESLAHLVSHYYNARSAVNERRFRIVGDRFGAC